jgi:ABC-type sugar transport system ATPase subunit
MTMGDRVAVMKRGVIQQVGSPEELYADPHNVFVAGFIGSPAMNLVRASLLDGAGSEDQIVGFRPEHVSRRNGRADAIPFTARVELVEYLGDEQLVHMTRKDASLQATLPVEEKVRNGQEAEFSIPRDKLLLFDAQTEQRVARRSERSVTSTSYTQRRAASSPAAEPAPKTSRASNRCLSGL